MKINTFKISIDGTWKKPRTVTEYRLLIKRTGNAVKERRARSMKSIERHIGLLTSPEPWRFYGVGESSRKGPDDYVCCAGTYHDQCSCGGLTMREETEERRRNLPPIESIRVERRQITSTPWEPLESATKPDAVDPVGSDSVEHQRPRATESDRPRGDVRHQDIPRWMGR